MREATKEELEKSFEECIESAKGLITKAMNEGDTPLVSPTVFLIMRKVPDPKNNPLPVAFKPLGDHDAPIRVGIFSPVTLTPPGWDQMPLEVFWPVLKMIAQSTNAYGTVVAMETWLAQALTSEEAAKLPASLEDYEHREEALLVTAEREGEYRIYQSLIRRDGEKFTLDPWETTISNSTAPKGSRYDRLRTNDPLNDEPDKMRVSGNVFRSVPANLKS